MPHIQIDYTANLEVDIQERKLVETLHQVAVESGIFPVWGIRTIAQPVGHYLVGNGAADNAFVQVFVRIGPGRDLALRQHIASLLFDALVRSMGTLMETRRLGCQLEVMEFDAALTHLANNHAEDFTSESPAILRRLVPQTASPV
jgi:5-carboxymethyl-2-hydroxymuconate isomerase